MFIVEVTFNSDPDGNSSKNYWQNRCIYGPFAKKSRAERFAQEIFPDDPDVEDSVVIELNRARDFLKG